MSPSAPSPREPQSPTLAALGVQPRPRATGPGVLGKPAPSGCRHLGDPPDRLGLRLAVAPDPSAPPGCRSPKERPSPTEASVRAASRPRPGPLLPIGPGPARPRVPMLPPAGRARTCRGRCRVSTKPSVFIPTGALCPCTSSAITAPAAAAAARLPSPASPSARGPVAGKGKSPHFRRKGSSTREETSRARGAGSGHVTATRPEVGAGPRGGGGAARWVLRAKPLSGLKGQVAPLSPFPDAIGSRAVSDVATGP